MGSYCSKHKNAVFWSSIVGLSAIFATSAYYLYKYIKEEDEEDNKKEKGALNEAPKNVNCELKPEEIFLNGELTLEGVVKIMLNINKLTEAYFAKDYPNLDKQRREAIDKDVEYNQLCQETLMNRQLCTQKASTDVLAKIPGNKLSMEKLQEYLQTIDPKKIEEYSLGLEELDENEKNISAKDAKDAYIYYASTFLEETNKFREKYNNPYMMVNENQQALIMMEFFAIKMKIDDMLYIKYKINDQKLKAVLFKNHLLMDPEIQKYQKQLDELDKSMNQ